MAIKMVIFSLIFFLFGFRIFAQNIDCGDTFYDLEQK